MSVAPAIPRRAALVQEPVGDKGIVLQFEHRHTEIRHKERSKADERAA